MGKRIKIKTIRVDDTKRFSLLLKAIKRFTGQKNIEQAIVELARYHIPHIVNELYPPKIEFLIAGGDMSGKCRGNGRKQTSRQISSLRVNPKRKA